MKVHHLALGIWEQDSSSPSTSSSSSSSTFSSSLTLNLKRLRPLAPKLSSSAATAAGIITSLDLNYSSKTTKCISQSPDASLMETQQPGVTRWNPTPEQIKVLEALYRGGMRTPNASQIEHITSELGKYGRIEGKNVFYWFQNHKARERQKQKRSALLTLSTHNRIASLPNPKLQEEEEEEEEMKEKSCNLSCKRKCRNWGSSLDLDLQAKGNNTDCTLELFPLHPEGKQMG